MWSGVFNWALPAVVIDFALTLIRSQTSSRGCLSYKVRISTWNNRSNGDFFVHYIALL